MMGSDAHTAFGHAARTALKRVLDAGDRPADRVTLESVVLSFNTDPTASAELLSRLLTTERVTAHGHAELWPLTQRVAELTAVAPQLTVALYAAAFGHEENSDEVTSMRGGVLPLTSTRRQDFDMVRYALAEGFAKVITINHDAGLQALREAVASVSRHRPDVRTTPPIVISWPGGTAGLIGDRSGWWDAQSLERHPQTMLDALQARFVALANARSELQALLAAMNGRDWPAAMIGRLLSAGAAAPAPRAALMQIAYVLLMQSAVLLHPDLEVSAARAIGAAFADVDETMRRELEAVVLALPDAIAEDDKDVRGRAEYRRDQLLGAVDIDRLVSAAARDHRTRLDAEGGPPPVDEDEARWITPEPRHPHPPANQAEARLRELVAPLRPIHDAHAHNTEPSIDPSSLITDMRTLLAAIDDLAPQLHEHALLEAHGHLGEVARAIGRQPAGKVTDQQRAIMRDVARALQTSSKPSGHDDAWDTNMPSFDWPSPRADAAKLWLQLAAHGEHDDELLAAVRAAAADDSALVRSKVAELVWWLRDRAPETAWKVVEALAVGEPRWFVATQTLTSVRRLEVLDADRALTIADALHARLLAAGAPRWALAASSAHLLVAWTRDATELGRAEADRLIALAATDPEAAEHVFSPWREALTAGDDNDLDTTRRHRAIELWTGIVEAALEPFEALIEAGGTDADRLKPLGQLLLRAATEVKFAAGASGLEREGEWQPAADEHARLWHEASALLDAACRIGIPAAADDIVKMLTSFIDVDPTEVLARLTVVLSAAERFGYQGDSLAETSFNELVAALLSRHRDIVLRDPLSRARLLEALSSFARAGSSSARRTLLGLDDLLR